MSEDRLLGAFGTLLVIVIMVLTMAAEVFPDFEIIPSRKKRSPGEVPVGADALAILYVLFWVGFGLMFIVGILVGTGLPAEGLIVAPVALTLWSMVQMLNLFCLRIIGERWIGLPLFGLLLLPNVAIGLGVPLLLYGLREGDSPLTSTETAAYTLLGAGNLIFHFGSMFVLLSPRRAKRIAMRIPAFRDLIGEHKPDAPSPEVMEAAPVPVGQLGIVKTPLRPVGKVAILGKTYTARSEGPFIALDTPVEVIDVQASELLVRESIPVGRKVQD